MLMTEKENKKESEADALPCGNYGFATTMGCRSAWGMKQTSGMFGGSHGRRR
jgi:hypothetical protein